MPETPIARELDMSKFIRFALLISVVSFTVFSIPAHASFTAICWITSGTLAPIRMQPDGDGGVTFYVETAHGDGRFFQMRPAGGHWEIISMHSLPKDSGLELDSAGYPYIHQN
jgi:hypothetical protein